ncbi:lumazine synthase [Entomophthora muscae]|uniref:Lumazine synthase n=1 Tax=Entomophthora muscae TaxID=34485 RepID=A0ACC2U9X4_9FUNG|nr:lumazine synthase [Entomophthora muscae]
MSETFSKGLPGSDIHHDGSNLRILIVHARWNSQVITKLVDGAIERMVNSHGVKRENIILKSVPGSYELPFAANRLINLSKNSCNSSAETSRPFDAVICIGTLIKGATMHFEYICEAVTQGITRVSLDTGVPVIFGVLACLTEEQALERCGELNGHNHGTDWGSAAVEMALLTI